MKKTMLIVLLVVFAVVSIALLKMKNRPNEENVFKIGVALPLTGDAAVYGQALKNGIELALTELQGTSRPKVRLIYEDDQYSPKFAVAAVKKLISLDKVSVIIGGAGSTTAEPIVQICGSNHVVLLSPCATAPSLSGSSPYFFRLWPSDNYDGQVMAHTAFEKLGVRKVAIFYVNAPYGQGIASVFKKQFENLGGEVSLEESYMQGATDFRLQLTKIKEDGADWVFIPGYIKEVTNILRQSVELGLTVRFIGGNSLYDPKLLELAGTAAEGAVFTIPMYDPKSDDLTIKKFVSAYKAQYGSEPDAFAATGYDALRVVLKAISLSGNGTSGEQIRQGMLQIKNFSGPNGAVTFDENGDVQKPLRLMTVKNGAFVEMSAE